MASGDVSSQPDRVESQVAQVPLTDSIRRFGFRDRGAFLFSELFVCCSTEEGSQGIHLHRAPHAEAQIVALCTPRDTEGFMRNISKRCRIVAILPKAHYLLKTLEIPRVPPEEVPNVLGFEIEAQLPAEFGPPEISYRELPTLKEGYLRYEVYVSRRDSLADYLSRLTGVGLHAHLLLPSAVIWQLLFDSVKEADLLVASSDSNRQLEIASIEKDKSLRVRTIACSYDAGAASGLEPGLVECLRPLLGHSRTETSPFVVGWMGRGCPRYSTDGTIVFKDMADLLPGIDSVNSEDVESNPFLAAAALATFGCQQADLLQTSNLLPGEMLTKRERVVIHKHLIVGAVCALLGVGLVYAALKVLVVRNRTISREIAIKTALIERKGEAVGRRIEQLEKVRWARATGDDFCNLLSGLYEVTPSGVTYSHVGLSEAGEIRLRGQARSLALPFLLPEKLEKHPTFEQVVLRDAGQRKKGAGTVTEFRIDCVLKRIAGQ